MGVIHLVDSHNHGSMMTHIIGCFNPNTQVSLISTDGVNKIWDLQEIMSAVAHGVSPGDIVLLGWITARNPHVDQSARILAEKCPVIVPAGNYGLSTQGFSPCDLPEVICVEAFNTQGERMSGSNYRPDGTGVPMLGVPIQHLDIQERGTSVAAAIYAALYARNSRPIFIRRYTELLRKKIS